MKKNDEKLDEKFQISLKFKDNDMIYLMKLSKIIKSQKVFILKAFVDEEILKYKGYEILEVKWSSKNIFKGNTDAYISPNGLELNLKTGSC
jgi:hypothetical protein